MMIPKTRSPRQASKQAPCKCTSIINPSRLMSVESPLSPLSMQKRPIPLPVLVHIFFHTSCSSMHISAMRSIIQARYRVLVKPFQQRLVHDQHCSTLHTRPHTSGADTSEPTGDALGAVDDLECFHNTFSVEAYLAVLLEGCAGAGGRDRLSANVGLLGGAFCRARR